MAFSVSGLKRAHPDGGANRFRAESPVDANAVLLFSDCNKIETLIDGPSDVIGFCTHIYLKVTRLND